MDVAPPIFDELQKRLSELMPHDRHRFRRRIQGARRIRDEQAQASVAREIAADLEVAAERLARRKARVPSIRYPSELPIVDKKDDILAAIRDHQVVIIAGETGSGKSTQLPKMCLELGRGSYGLIGHTQPRRLAARSIAERIAEELGGTPGDAVGYQVRFTDRTDEDTLVKVMTDGILLNEIQHDPELRRYDTLIIDEAHERSLNIDFILGYLKQLLPRRPDLKVIITSATIDPERFARHFSDAVQSPPEIRNAKGQRGVLGGPDAASKHDGARHAAVVRSIADVPVIEVSGRMYPVEIRYRPIVDLEDPDADPDRDQTQAICDAVDELSTAGRGDILVFLSGEREIRDTADALGKRRLRHTEILPLYARLSAAEQHRVFESHPGRRIVLATNVAETSLTVPGIKYVIDPGTARISRYSHRTKVQRLPIEPISQASARQRAGRCGRTSDGTCIRLYSEQDYSLRPAYTDPEILRTNLASVILQMTAAGLGDVESFPFVDPPDRRNIKDGIDLLEELGALEPLDSAKTARKRLTSIGGKLAQLPIDPRLARMVLEADQGGCVREVVIIAAALSIQDPRERPNDKQQAADQQHARFADKDSDFLTYLNLWDYLRDRQRTLSSNQFRRMCRTEFLNYLRIREWQDIYGQLRQIVKTLGLSINRDAGDPQRVHQAILAGLLSHVGVEDRDRREYQGARGARFVIFPGSALFKRRPPWVMAAELVETSRLWGRIAARIEPEWIEPLASHLVKRHYSEPHWEKSRGAVMASERVTLYGIPIVTGRKVNYARIDPDFSRELFIRHALVEGDWETRHAFFHENRRMLEEVEDLERRARRRDILVDDETLFDFYDQRIGKEVVSAAHFDSWWRKTRRRDPELLRFDVSMIVNKDAAKPSEQDYPDFWEQDGLRLRLTYQFEPGTDADGVTVHIPLPVLNRVDADDLTWQVPGLREELITALIRSLPKTIRRSFVPAPNYAKAVLDRVSPRKEPLLSAVGRELQRMGGPPVPREAWELGRVPDYLKMTFRVVEARGGRDRTIAEGKDLDALRRKVEKKARTILSDVAAEQGVERGGLRAWDFDTLPRTYQGTRDGHTVKAFPALVDEGDSVGIRLMPTEGRQHEEMWRGTRRLLLLNAPPAPKLLQGRLTNQAKLALSYNPHGSVAAVLDDCLSCAADTLMREAGGPAWNAEGFRKLSNTVRGELSDTVGNIVDTVQSILSTAHALEQRLSRTVGPALARSVDDIRGQLSELVYPGFVTATGWGRLRDVVRYLRAIERRLDKLPEDPHRDRERMLIVQRLDERYQELREARPGDEQVCRIRWMIQELRVSYFAQALGTPYSVSEKRIQRALDDLTV